MPAENFDINKTLIAHSEEDSLNEITNCNGQPENQNYSKLQKLNDIVKSFFNNPKILPKLPDAEKNGQKNSSIKEKTYAMCKKVKQNVFQSSDSNKIKYNLVNDKTQNSFKKEFDEIDMNYYRRIEDNERSFVRKDENCFVSQKDRLMEDLDRFGLKNDRTVEENEGSFENEELKYFESYENNQSLAGVKISSKDFSIKADNIIKASSSREDVFAMGNNANSHTDFKDFDRASVNTSTESIYGRKRHNLCSGSDEIMHRESRCLERRISLEYCNQDSEKAPSEYKTKEFIRTNVVSFASPRLLSGSAVILNRDDTNVKFSTFKPDVKIVEQPPIFARISNTDLHSGGQVVLEELTNSFNYPNFYGENPIAYDETPDILYNHQQRFADCTCQSKISARSFSGSRLTSESCTGISLPELDHTNTLNSEFKCPSSTERLSGGSLVKSFEVENEIFLDFLSKTITIDNDTSSSGNDSLSNDSIDTAVEFGGINSNGDKCHCRCHLDYNKNRIRYGYSSETSLMLPDEALLSNDLCDLKYSQSNMKKQRKNSILKSGFSLISKKKIISRSVSEYSFNSWFTNNGSSDSMNHDIVSSRSRAAHDLNIPRSLSRYSFDPRSSAESDISSQNKTRISKTHSFPYFE